MQHPSPITPATRLCALLGSPVAHSGSPFMHNAAFAAAGLDARYLAFDVPAGALRDAVRGLAALGAVGANVTVPHKEQALALADEAGPSARRSGSANVLAFRHGRVYADDTDGPGFVRALADAGIELRGARMLVLGAGGAARAVVAAALAAGARRVWIVNRTPERAHRLARDLGGAGAGIAVPGETDLPRALSEATLLVNATSLGLRAGDPAPLRRWDEVRRDAVAVDLVYAPHETPFLREARAAGLSTLDGRRMLVWQAALAWEAWFGRVGPVDVMEAALARWLAAAGGRQGAGQGAVPPQEEARG